MSVADDLSRDKHMLRQNTPQLQSTAKGRRILALPRELDFDPYFGRLSNGLECQGWKVDNFSFRRALLHQYDILHLHHPAWVFLNRRKLIAVTRLLAGVALIALARARGARIVWSLHNLVAHEQYHPRLERLYLNWISKHISLSIHMSQSGREAALKQFPRLTDRCSVVIPLMHFAETFRPLKEPSEARQHLGLDEKIKVILLLGQIRRYKNVPELMRAFSNLSGEELRLFIVGKKPLEKDVVAEIEMLAAKDPRAILSLKWASIEAVKIHMAAATLVVAPYREVLNSGSALLALTHARPVLLPNRGAMADLQSEVGPQWVRLYDPPLTSVELERALQWAATTRGPSPALSTFEPDSMVSAHADAFRALAASGRAFANRRHG
jgi:beta-1,4-mannosyltransferase